MQGTKWNIMVFMDATNFKAHLQKKTLGILDLVYSYKYLFLLDLFYVKLSDQIEFLSQFILTLRLMWSLDHHQQQFGCL